MDSVAEQDDDDVMIGLGWVVLFVLGWVGLGWVGWIACGVRQSIFFLFYFILTVYNPNPKSINNPIQYSNNGRTRVDHGDAFRHYRRSLVRDHDIFVASIPHGGRKSQHLRCRSRAHLHGCVRPRAARSHQSSALGRTRSGCNYINITILI